MMFFEKNKALKQTKHADYAIHSLPQPAHLTDLPTVYMSTYRQVALNWQHASLLSKKIKGGIDPSCLAEVEQKMNIFWGCFIIRKSSFGIWPCHGKGPHSYSFIGVDQQTPESKSRSETTQTDMAFKDFRYREKWVATFVVAAQSVSTVIVMFKTSVNMGDNKKNSKSDVPIHHTGYY